MFVKLATVSALATLGMGWAHSDAPSRRACCESEAAAPLVGCCPAESCCTISHPESCYAFTAAVPVFAFELATPNRVALPLLELATGPVSWACDFESLSVHGPDRCRAPPGHRVVHSSHQPLINI